MGLGAWGCVGIQDGELELGGVLLGDGVLGEGVLEGGKELGAADLEDEVGVGGRVDELEVAPLLEGGVELVVADVGAAGDLVGEGVVGAGVGEEDGFGGGDAGDDGRRVGAAGRVERSRGRRRAGGARGGGRRRRFLRQAKG